MNEIAKRLSERLFDQPLIGNQYRSDFIEEMIAPFLKKTGWAYAGADWGVPVFPLTRHGRAWLEPAPGPAKPDPGGHPRFDATS